MQRPMSAMIRPTTRPRSSSRMSVSSRHGAGTRYSDDDGKTAVKVGMSHCLEPGLRVGRIATECNAFFCFRNLLLTNISALAVRVRPPLRPEDPGYDLIPQRFRRSTCQVSSPTNLTVESAQGKKLFVFDRVFGEEVDQEGVWEYLSESVNSFVQGYNVSVLAYGQSGAGKSYTMGTSGSQEQNDARLMGEYPNLEAVGNGEQAKLDAMRR